MEFHLLKSARDKYGFSEDFFLRDNGFVRFNYRAVRELTEKLNTGRRINGISEVKFSELLAAGLLHQLFLHILSTYQKTVNPHLHENLSSWLTSKLRVQSSDTALLAFIEQFPPLKVYLNHQTSEEYLQSYENDKPNRWSMLEQIVLVFLANENPACEGFVELFDDKSLAWQISHRDMLNVLEDFFKTQPKFGKTDATIFELLKAPMFASPFSLQGQLAYLRYEFSEFADTVVTDLILSVEDIMKEEHKPSFLGPGPTLVPSFNLNAFLNPESTKTQTSYEDSYAEPAQYSPDTAWMPQVVLMSKNAFVWLDQLSKKYKREIRRLDQIPDDELNQLAQWGITGLWLIGVWERSSASQIIKRFKGNDEAEASAYSLYDYIIAERLGGNAALENLKHRALQKGIRLAGDMVPNHMGIFSKWVMNYPEAFLQLPYPPYPNYKFTGPNLSANERYDIRIEDGYWDYADAAVTFRWEDKLKGTVRYIYHGNDGTSFPWNDTAQLDFIMPEVREAVIQLILYISKLFPILRFDAAMTLTKKHFQRLWYPQAGSGGSIPTRSEHGLSRKQFDELMPVEFWREVVDRVAAEAPDTLLMAEAFWLTEGFFVRTLGMHRVYNSAFMNMMKKEENAKYRQVIKNILEYDPRILQRFVNFMSNPDEETAVAQFGKGDKYFGTAAMLVTLPGMPMLGHGQIEGFTEKYGMEFSKEMWEEKVDTELKYRHEREIFPLMRMRELFSGADNFVLYDVRDELGDVDEDVFAYSNRHGDKKTLVVYQNKFDSTAVWIYLSSAMIAYSANGHQKLVHKTIAEALDFPPQPNTYLIFRDTKSGLEFIRNSRDIVHRGLKLVLHAYEYFVFTDFRIVQDYDGRYGKLADNLGLSGVPSIDEAYRELVYEPLLKAFEGYLNANSFTKFIEDKEYTKQYCKDFEVFTETIANLLEIKTEISQSMQSMERLTSVLFDLSNIHNLKHKRQNPADQRLLEFFSNIIPQERHKDSRFWKVYAAFVSVAEIGRIKGGENYEDVSAKWFEEWLFKKSLSKTCRTIGTEWNQSVRDTNLVAILLKYRKLSDTFKGFRRYWKVIELLANNDAERLIGEHWSDGIRYFHKQSFQELAGSLFIVSVIDTFARNDLRTSAKIRIIRSNFAHLEILENIAELSEYRLDKFKTMLSYSAGQSERQVIQ